MAARRCVPSQSRHFDQSLGTDRRPPFWNSGRPLETAPAGKGLPAPSPRVLQMKSPSLCFWLFSSSLLLCDPSCAYFASDLRLEPSDAGGALGLVGAKRESTAFTVRDPRKPTDFRVVLDASWTLNARSERRFPNVRTWVRFPSPAPSLCFHLLEDQVEGLSVSRIDTYCVNPTVRKYQFEEFGFFRVILLNV